MRPLLVTRCSSRLNAMARRLTGAAKQTQNLVTRRAARQLTGTAKQTQSLVKHLTVREVAAGRFQGNSVELGWGRVYGGQTMSQALDAAHRTAPGRVVHSFTSYFYRPGRTDEPMDFSVEALSDGRALACRRVTASQKGVDIFSMLCSLQSASAAPARPLEHQRPLTAPPPDDWRPEAVPTLQERMRPHEHLLPTPLRKIYLNDASPFELRQRDFTAPSETGASEPATSSFIKLAAPVGDDAALHARLLAYISDWGFISTALRPHEGISNYARGVQLATISHGVTYHRADLLRLDEDYVLVRHRSPSASQGRGFVVAEFLARDGTLLASAQQEGVVRVLMDK